MLKAMAVVCLWVAIPGARGAGGALAFEVASIKPAAPQAPGRFAISMGGDAGRIDYKFVSLKMVIERAFTIKSYQISGPDWLDSERFDIVAKLPEGAKSSDVPAMLQTLLAERFKLTFHREQKTLPVYAMVVAKTGSKLPKVESEEGGMSMSMGSRGRQLTGRTTMDSFSGLLSRILDRPVLDLTELKGVYQVDVAWTPDDRETGSPMGGIRPAAGDHPPAENSDAPTTPSLFAALQEKLGLRLETRRGPVDIVVIDTVERLPTQN